MAQADFQPTWALITEPPNYPDKPSVGKLEIIWDANYKSLYRRLSPYSNYSTGLFTWGDQPFNYTYIDQAGTGISALTEAESRIFPIGSATLDVIRVTKFLASGAGISFLAKQFLLQTGNPYNETRIYNPTSPIVAAGMPLALGSIRPLRFLDTSGGLLGIASSLIGNSIPNAIFGPPAVHKPSGTAPGALTDGTYVPTQTSGGKGLLRAGTAKVAKGNLQSKWVDVSSNGGGITNSFGDIVKNFATSLFSNFIPQNQNDIKYRSDEGTYGLMIGGSGTRFDYTGASGQNYSFGQQWIAGNSGTNTMRPNKQYPNSPYRIFIKYINGTRTNYLNISTGGFQFTISDLGQVGYNIAESTIKNNPGYRYGDSVGERISTKNGDLYTNSDVMVQYKFYSDPSQTFPTKDPEAKKIKKVSDSLKNLLNNINNSSGGGLYNTDNASESDPDGIILPSPDEDYNYDRLFNTRKPNQSPNNFKYGLLNAYRNSGVRMISNNLTNNINSSYKLAGAGNFDAINTLTVLNGDKKINNSMLKGWTEWSPYEDDLIALFFYDVVNDKYIPFRASVKGLVENGNASWEESVYIGRSDKLYSYSGFNRNLNFTVQILINSIAELLPTWQRINYITTAIKPSNYTHANLTLNNSTVTNRFMIPPMFMLTLGDMYRDQPVLIQSITTTIPDDAAWEILNEDNSGQVNWKYLADTIGSSVTYGEYGQLPRNVELGFGLILLEKERAIVGGANFGHAPRNNTYSDWNYTTVPEAADPKLLSKNLVVNVTT